MPERRPHALRARPDRRRHLQPRLPGRRRRRPRRSCAWWCERLARDCVEAAEPGLFVDQKWVDFVPGLLALPHPARPRLQRRLLEPADAPRRSADRAAGRVDGEPLRFFHYSGYSPSRPDRALEVPEPRRPASRSTSARCCATLCDDYAARLERNGFAECSARALRLRRPRRPRARPAAAPLYRTALKRAETRGVRSRRTRSHTACGGPSGCASRCIPTSRVSPCSCTCC